MKILLKPVKTSVCLVFILSLLFVACTKEKSGSGGNNNDAIEEQVSQINAESDAEAEIVFNGIFDDVMGASDDVGMAGTGWYGRYSNGAAFERVQACFTVTITSLSPPTLFPVRIVIDFGTGCQGRDGRTRKGKIITEYSARLIVPGAMAVTSFEDYFVDSIKVEGTLKITNTSSPVNTQPLTRSFKKEVINAKLSKPNGNYIEWNSTKTITQLEGLVTPNLPADDVFKIEGSSLGRAKKGNLLVAWQSTVEEPLIKKFLCRWIVKGKIKTTRANSTTNNQWIAVLDFGDGTCDRKATLTVNGRTIEITLP